MGGPLSGLKRSPMLRTTVLKTLNSAANFGSDTDGGGMSSSRTSPKTTWFRSYMGQAQQQRTHQTHSHADQ